MHYLVKKIVNILTMCNNKQTNENINKNCL